MEKKLMLALDAATIRGIVRLANEYEIKREDIVSLVKEGDHFVLVYYK